MIENNLIISNSQNKREVMVCSRELSQVGDENQDVLANTNIINNKEVKDKRYIKRKIERVAIFIDGSNFYHSTKKILKENEKINYKKLLNVLTGNRTLVDAFYYVAQLDRGVDLEKYEKHKEFLEDLDKIPKLTVRLCDLKKIKTDGKVIYLIKGDDIKLAQDLLMGAFDNLYDTAILVSGDEDFFSVIEILRKRFKKRVGNAYFRSSSSYKLRRACNFSIKLNKIVSKFVDKKKEEKFRSSSAVKRQH